MPKYRKKPKLSTTKSRIQKQQSYNSKVRKKPKRTLELKAKNIKFKANKQQRQSQN